jgi:hypothetical protein
MAYKQKPNTGALFSNKKRTSDQQPNARGDCLVVCPHCGAASKLLISAWTNSTKAGEKYQRLKLSSPPDEQTAPAAPSAKANAVERQAAQAQAGGDPFPQEPQFTEEEIPF